MSSAMYGSDPTPAEAQGVGPGLHGAALRLTDAVPRISTPPFVAPFPALVWIGLILREPIAFSTVAGLFLIVGGTFLQQQAAAEQA